jgi:peptide-methionine (S)-S-oxide reductase
MEQTCDLPNANRTADKGAFPDPLRDLEATDGVHSAVFAAGCFWCVEAVFKQLDGVLAVTSGYTGGTAQTADYETVCTGRTDHAEVIKIDYDPKRISFGRLLKIFFSVAHDPTQLNRQGNDRGRQYRSAIFYGSESQHEIARAYIQQLTEAGVFKQPIVTELAPLGAFYKAENYHQNYAELNPNQPYIAAVSTPKVEKLKQKYGEYLRK